MTFATPMLAILAAAVAIPSLVILYFLKLRRRDVEVSSTLLWKKAIQDLQANAPFQKLRRNILLLLQLIALAAALFALAQPELKGATISGDRHVILIDRSASMGASDAGEPGVREGVTRLAKAKREAIELVKSLREGSVLGRLSSGSAGDEAMVIVFDTAAEVLQPFTSDKAALERAIDSITLVDAPSRVAQAMGLAKANARGGSASGESPAQDTPSDADGEAASSERSATIHLWSDGALPDADEARPDPGDDVVYHVVGRDDAPNVGITAIRADREYDDRTKLSVFVALQSTAREQREVDVELFIDGVRAGVKSVGIPAAVPARNELDGDQVESGPGSASPAMLWKPSAASVVFAMQRNEGGVAAVRVVQRDADANDPTRADVLAVDDRAWTVIPPARRTGVALVGASNLFVRALLEGLPLARLESLTSAEFESRAAAGTMDEFDVVVLDAWVPAGDLPPGRYLVLGATPGGSSGISHAEPGPPGTIIEWQRDHPVLRPLALDSLVIAESVTPEFDASRGVSVLAQTEHGPAMFEIARPDLRAIVVPFSIAGSNWPFDVSFVVFMAGALDYLAGADDPTGTGVELRPGDVLVERLPAGAEDVRLNEPEGTSASLPLTPDGRVVFGPLRRAGLYEVSWSGPAGAGDRAGDAGRPARTVACNLASAAESDVPARPSVTLASVVVRASDASEREGRRPLWPWLVLGALGVVMLEWYVYNRKVHV
ncbi:MAG: VWA domain-containing protein [Phycisphaerales bacterium]|jgi:hypothetical protein|nr:VWA domain-containing protein [Phycisphaerales bacterium]